MFPKSILTSVVTDMKVVAERHSCQLQFFVNDSPFLCESKPCSSCLAFVSTASHEFA